MNKRFIPLVLCLLLLCSSCAMISGDRSQRVVARYGDIGLSDLGLLCEHYDQTMLSSYTLSEIKDLSNVDDLWYDFRPESMSFEEIPEWWSFIDILSWLLEEGEEDEANEWVEDFSKQHDAALKYAEELEKRLNMIYSLLEKSE